MYQDRQKVEGERILRVRVFLDSLWRQVVNRPRVAPADQEVYRHWDGTS